MLLRPPAPVPVAPHLALRSCQNPKSRVPRSWRHRSTSTELTSSSRRTSSSRARRCLPTRCSRATSRGPGSFTRPRAPWERIEPVAATLGDLDPNIDAREGDVPDEEWRGFHRIEQALWVDEITEGQEEYARQLRTDVEQLQGEVQDLELRPEDLVTGSIELLNEVSAGKITGEEERYSRTDLYDIQANVEGSEAAFEALRPSLEERDPGLVAEIEDRFGAVYETLEPYRQGDGWVPYTELDEGERRRISQRIDALAEHLSQIGQVLEA